MSNSWEEIIMHTPTTKKETETEILWNNHFITIGGKSIFYRQWYNARVKTLSDILDKEETFLSLPKFGKKYKLKQTIYVIWIVQCHSKEKPLTTTSKTNQLLQDSPQHTL